MTFTLLPPAPLSDLLGVEVQAHGDVLDDLSALGAPTADGQFLVATGAGAFAYREGSAARSAMGLGSAATAAAQSGATDATAGRLMAVGAFGLGATSVMPLVANANTAVVAGVYTTTVSTANLPAAATATGFLLVYRSYNVVIQYAARHSETTPLFRRTSGDSGATWGAWSAVGGPWLGTVSQASGVPSGALIESGSNANGEYVRFANGTQRCVHTLTASASAGVTWTFPAAFSAAPKVVGSAAAAVLSSVQRDAAASTTAVVLSCRDKADARRADVMDLVAIGRWF